MYESKQKQEGAVVIFDKAFHKEHLDEVEREKFIRDAIDRDSVDIHFQPIYYHEKLYSIEALSRFESRPFGTSINALMRTAKRTKVAGSFYNYMMQAGLRAYQKVSKELESFKPPFLNLNITIHQLAQENFAKQVLDYVLLLELKPSLIYLEITEQALESTEILFKQNIEKLKKSGFKFSIDDFGTGYSSIKRLIDYDFDQIKLDRSFFTGIKNNKKLQLATKVAADFGASLEMEVLAEGVENEEEYAFIQEFGIPYVQGYFFAKPMSVPQCITLIKNSL